MIYTVNIRPIENDDVFISVNNDQPDETNRKVTAYNDYIKGKKLVLKGKSGPVLTITCGTLDQSSYYQLQANLVSLGQQYHMTSYLYLSPDNSEIRNKCIADFKSHNFPRKKNIIPPRLISCFTDNATVSNDVAGYYSLYKDEYKNKVTLIFLPLIYVPEHKIKITDFASCISLDLTDIFAQGNFDQCKTLIESLHIRFTAALYSEDILQRIAKNGLHYVLKNILLDEENGLPLPELPELLVTYEKEKNIDKADHKITEADINEHTKLDLTGMNLDEIPESITNLTQLEELYLGSNQLSYLPEFIGTLTNLKILWADSNQLTRLPESIGKLTKLHTLVLAINNIDRLPDSFKNLKKLKLLHLLSNPVSIEPDYFKQFPELETVTNDKIK